MIKYLIGMVVCFVAVSVAVMIWGGHPVREFVWTLTTGWVTYLARVTAAMHVDLVSLLFGLALFAIMVVAIHGICAGSLRTSGRQWRWTWSIASSVLVVVLFVSGTSFVGLVSKSRWMLETEQPLTRQTVEYPRRTSSRYFLESFARDVLTETSWTNTYVNEVPKQGEPNPVLSWQTQVALMSWEHPIGPEDDFELDKTRPWDELPNATMYRRIMPAFLNLDLIVESFHDERGFALSHYSANSHLINDQRSWTTEQIVDGTGTTLMVGQVNDGFMPWGQPGNWRDPAEGINRGPTGFGGALSQKGALFLMADGSVKLLSEDTDSEVLKALATPAGGEDIAVPD